MTTLTIEQAMRNYLESVSLRSKNDHTPRAYKNGLNFFLQTLKDHQLDPASSPIEVLSEDAVSWMLSAIKVHAPNTEMLYIAAVKDFYKYLVAERLAKINLPRLELLIKRRSRRSGQRLPQFPRDDIEKTLAFVNYFTEQVFDDENIKLRAYRDRAFLLTLADTGLRVHEACALRRGDLDWNEGRAIIIGKGDKQAVIRFSTRAMQALREYLYVRQHIDGSSGRPLPSLPLFARHDKGAGKKVKPISTATGRNIVHERVRQAIGEETAGTITPHSFRHYFVTTVLRASGNLKLAQELARHSNIQVTERYAHLASDELDRGYYEIFEEDQ